MTASPKPSLPTGDLVAPAFDYWIRKSPFFEKTLEAGCTRFSVAEGAYYPIQYASPLAEYEAITERASLWDVPAESPIEVRGPDAAAFLEWAQPRDLSRVTVGACRYIVCTNEDGGLVFDSVLLKLAEDRFWLSGSADWLRGLAVGRGFRAEIFQTEVSPLQLQGPRSRAVLQAFGVPGIADLKVYRFLEATVDGVPLIVTRTGWSGELGFEIYLRDNDKAGALWDRLLEAGRAFGLNVTASSEMRRVEAGILNYGTDFAEADTPYHVGLGRLVDLDKPHDFVGRSALRRLAGAPLARRLTGLLLEDAPSAPFESPWPARRDQAPIGAASVVVYSPALDRWIGLAMLDAATIDEATSFELLSPAGPVAAIPAEIPFIDKDRARMRA